MKTLNQNLLAIALIATALGLFFVGASFWSHPDQAHADSNVPNFITTKPSISTSVTVGTGSTQLLASSSSRVYAVIVNDSADVVYLNISNNAASGKGIRLNASGGSYEINNDNLFTGAVNAISGGSGNDNVTVLASQ